MNNPFSKIRLFWGETISELKKSSWPTRKELKDYTLLVLFGIVCLGAYIYIIDFSLFNLVTYVSDLFRA